MTAHFRVRKSPARVKEVRFPGVSGFWTVSMGNEYYEIEQSGYVDFGETDYSSQSQILRKIKFDDQPDVQDGRRLVVIDTMNGEIYEHCQLKDVEVQNVNPRLARYRYLWKQQRSNDVN